MPHAPATDVDPEPEAVAFNPLDPALVEDPHPAYRRLRESAPAHFVAALGMWVVTDHDGVRAIVRSKDADVRFAEFQRLRQGPDVDNEPYFRGMGDFVLTKDGEDHRRVRKAFSRHFVPPRINPLRPAMVARASELVDAFATAGEVDVMEHFAVPLPLSTISELLGVPTSADAQIAQWVHDFKPALQFLPMTPEELAGANAATEGLTEYFAELVAERRQAPGEDLLSGLISEADAGNLSEHELLSNAWGLYLAGHETSASLIGNALIVLDRNPDERAALIADRTLLPNAIEEILRFESPGQANFRVVAVDTDVGGTTIPAGSPAVVYYPAANRDSHRFPDPDRFDIRRPNAGDHIAFSSGPHVCPGQHLARMTLEVALEVLLARLPNLRVLDEQVNWHPTPLMRGPATLTVGWDPN